jgi:DNA (cytosine-5)-methyltransferase 1
MRILDLFSGIGGFSLGLEKAGFETAAFCEFDEHARKVLKKHWPTVPIFNDVNTLTGLEVEFTVGKIDVICGGFPCQDISVAGKQRGLINEEGSVTRSGLWFEYKRLIGELRPSYVIIENVAALRSNGLVTVLQDLWTLGYNAEWHIISARSIGSCHLRERIWVIAYPNGEGMEGSSVKGSGGKTDIKKAFADLRAPGRGQEIKSPNADDVRLGKPFASEEEKSEWWAKRTASQRDWWEVESAICRMDDAISDGLHESERFRKQRIKQLGNSIVPGIAEIIGHSIMDFETKGFM